jgi:hypothetical protein
LRSRFLIYIQVSEDGPAVKLNITVRVPRNRANSASFMSTELKTLLPGFSHEFGEISEDAGFSVIDVGAAGGLVHAKVLQGCWFIFVNKYADGDGRNCLQNIRADIIHINTTSAPITGTFNVTSSLRLSTINSPINVKVTAYNGNSGNGWPPQLPSDLPLEVRLETMNA